MSAMPISSLFGGSGGGSVSGGFYEQLLLTGSGTFTAPVTGRYLISAGGAGSAGSRSSAAAGAAGGSAGGFSQKLVSLTAGDQITYNCGTGGVGVNVDGPGAPGTVTTVSGPGINLVANGGTSTAGGTATGGDINVTGGRSIPPANTWGGGGAMGIYGRGVDATTRGGGAGVGEPGGRAIGDGGGAIMGQGGNQGFAGRILLPMGRGGLSASPNFPSLGQASGMNGDAGGGGGAGGGGTNYTNNGGDGGLFGGGGAAGNGSSGTGGRGGLGAGGGSAYSGRPGDGGNGFVIIEYYRS